MRLDNGSMRHFGYSGNGWSQTTIDYKTGRWDRTAYYLSFDASDINSSNSDARWFGFPVRCLVYYVILYLLLFGILCYSLPTTFSVRVSLSSLPCVLSNW